MVICTNTSCIFKTYNGGCLFNDASCSSCAYRPRIASKKPPLGVMPRDIWDRKRQEELAEAMARYLDAGMKIPTEWIEEYNEICDRWEEDEK